MTGIAKVMRSLRTLFCLEPTLVLCHYEAGVDDNSVRLCLSVFGKGKLQFVGDSLVMDIFMVIASLYVV